MCPGDLITIPMYTGIRLGDKIKVVYWDCEVIERVNYDGVNYLILQEGTRRVIMPERALISPLW